MDDQTKPTNDLYNNDSAQAADRPLTSFLQAQQAVKTLEESDEGDAVPEPVPADDKVSEAGNESEASEEGREDAITDQVSEEPAPEAVQGERSKFEDGPKVEEVTSPEIDQNKLNTALKALRQVEQQITTVIKLLETGDATAATGALKAAGSATPAPASGLKGEDLATLKPIDGRVVEGVFDGRGMVGSDGKSYMVPPNYASKSKLVEGDMLKLTITPKGSFIYKQIGPIERSRLIGALGFDQTIGEYYATSENRRWNVIKASVTYFKGEPGDEVVLLVPKNAPSKWAAVENIIKRNPLG